MPKITVEELRYLSMLKGMEDQTRYLIGTGIKHDSHRRYGRPPNPYGPGGFDMSHATDQDMIAWSERICTEMCPGDTDLKNIQWLSPTGCTSLYGVLSAELRRRLGRMAAEEFHARVEANVPRKAVRP